MPPRKKSSVKRSLNFKGKLVQPGIAASFLRKKFANVPDVSDDIKKGHVLFLYIDNDRNVRLAERKLSVVLNCQPIAHHTIQIVVNKSILKFRNLTNDSDMKRFSEICAEKFSLVFAPPKTKRQVPVISQDHVASTGAQAFVSPLTTRQTAACATCRIRRGNMEKNSQKKTTARKLANIERKRLEKLSLKRVTERLKRRNATIEKLKTKSPNNENERLRREIKKLKMVVKYSKAKKDAAVAKLNQVERNHRKTVKALETDYQNRLFHIREELESEKSKK